MFATILNLGFGAFIKLVSAGFSQWMDFQRQKELAIINAPKETIIALQGGTDRADWSARITRVILALAFMGVWAYLMWHIVVVRPDIEYKIFVERSQSWIFKYLTPWPVNEQGIATISAGSLLWQFKSMIEILVGFYFTKIGK